MAVEVEHADVLLVLQVVDDAVERVGIARLDRLEVHLVGDELVDPLVAQLADQTLVRDARIGREDQDRTGPGKDEIRSRAHRCLPPLVESVLKVSLPPWDCQGRYIKAVP